MEEKKNRIYRTIMIIVLTIFVTFMLTSFWMYSYLKDSNQTVALSEDSSLLKDLTKRSKNKKFY